MVINRLHQVLLATISASSTVLSKTTRNRDIIRSTAEVCYYPTGEQAQDFEVCDSTADISLCCPSGYTCFNNSLCVVTTTDKAYPDLVEGTALRGACTDQGWDEDVCGSWCLDSNNKDNGNLIACGPTSDGTGERFCCEGDYNSGACACSSNGGAFTVTDGMAETVIGERGITMTGTLSYLVTATDASVAFRSSSSSTSSTTLATPTTLETASASDRISSASIYHVDSTLTETIKAPTGTASTTVPVSTANHHLTGVETTVPTAVAIPPSSADSDNNNSRTASLATKLGLGLGLPFIILLILGLVACLYLRQKRRQKQALYERPPPFDFDAPEMAPVSVADFAYPRSAAPAPAPAASGRPGGAATAAAATNMTVPPPAVRTRRSVRSRNSWVPGRNSSHASQLPARRGTGGSRHQRQRRAGGGTDAAATAAAAATATANNGVSGVPVREASRTANWPLPGGVVEKTRWQEEEGGGGGGVQGQGQGQEEGEEEEEENNIRNIGGRREVRYISPQHSYRQWEHAPLPQVPTTATGQGQQQQQQQQARPQNLTVEVIDSPDGGGIGEISPLSSSGSPTYNRGRISAVSGIVPYP